MNTKKPGISPRLQPSKIGFLELFEQFGQFLHPPLYFGRDGVAAAVFVNRWPTAEQQPPEQIRADPVRFFSKFFRRHALSPRFSGALLSLLLRESFRDFHHHGITIRRSEKPVAPENKVVAIFNCIAQFIVSNKNCNRRIVGNFRAAVAHQTDQLCPAFEGLPLDVFAILEFDPASVFHLLPHFVFWFQGVYSLPCSGIYYTTVFGKKQEQIIKILIKLSVFL
nr:MAG TPA: hypothetical protein [Caudoviricetes sp.]